jgi:hypothetical protein
MGTACQPPPAAHAPSFRPAGGSKCSLGRLQQLLAQVRWPRGAAAPGGMCGGRLWLTAGGGVQHADPLQGCEETPPALFIYPGCARREALCSRPDCNLGLRRLTQRRVPNSSVTVNTVGSVMHKSPVTVSGAQGGSLIPTQSLTMRLQKGTGPVAEEAAARSGAAHGSVPPTIQGLLVEVRASLCRLLFTLFSLFSFLFTLSFLSVAGQTV